MLLSDTDPGGPAVAAPAWYADLSPAELLRLLDELGHALPLGGGAAPGREDCRLSLCPGRLVALPDRYADFSLRASLPRSRLASARWIEHWNRSHRFTRLYGTASVLVLEMDVSLAGGVGLGHLLHAIEHWERTLDAWLRALKGVH